MNKVTQQEFDGFKLRVINSIMDIIKEYGQNDKTFEIHPTLYLKAFNKTHKICPLPGELFESDSLKDIAIDLSRQMIKESESPMMAFVTEGYQASIHEKNVRDINDLPRPSQLPEDQRDEVIFIAFESVNLNQYMISFIKKWDDQTQKFNLHPSNMGAEQPTGTAAGRFSNFYNK